VAARLVDEVEITEFELLRTAARQLHRCAAADEGLAGLVDAVEQVAEALFLRFGQGLAQRLADDDAMPDEVLVGRVGHFADVLGPAEHGEKSGRLLEEIGEPFPLSVQLLTGGDAVGGFGAHDQSAADRTAGVADGAVAVGPVDVFELAVAEDGDELVLMPTGLAMGHNGFDLRPDDGPDFTPAVCSTLAQGAGVFVFTDAGSIAVVVELDEVFTPPQKHGVA